MSRDRLVVGIRDAVLSQLLQLDADLTLETAKKKIRQREAAGEQNKERHGLMCVGPTDGRKTTVNEILKEALICLHKAGHKHYYYQGTHLSAQSRS